ncbi:MAG TPA: hypothetical protein VKT78_19790 [Fimbriimonadaceae bacterium]|nr:hypothetical protein [Fimbriimonadaceae bacterium]
MIEVIFVVHARGKVTSVGGSLDNLPEIGQLVTKNGRQHKVLKVTLHKGVKHPKPLHRPIVDIEPVPENRTES